jgi:hypothetical protein
MRGILMDIKKNYDYSGWKNCILMTDGKVEVVVTADIGPRIVRFGFTGEDNIFGEMKEQQGKKGGDEWLIYGGHRFWHSPESYPRTTYPDNSPVQYSWDGNTLKLIQDTEKTTGIQKEIEINLVKESGSVIVLHRLINHNLWEIEAAPWALTVMAKRGRAIIPHESYQPHSKKITPARPLVLWSYTEMKDARWIWGNRFIQLKQDPGAEGCQKIGVLNTLGWIAYYLDGKVFIKRYKYDQKAKYPDFGSNTEVYTDKDIIELETLGGLERIPPGGSIDHTEKWFLFKEKLGEDEESLENGLIPLINKTDDMS